MLLYLVNFFHPKTRKIVLRNSKYRTEIIISSWLIIISMPWVCKFIAFLLCCCPIDYYNRQDYNGLTNIFTNLCLPRSSIKNETNHSRIQLLQRIVCIASFLLFLRNNFVWNLKNFEKLILKVNPTQIKCRRLDKKYFRILLSRR